MRSYDITGFIHPVYYILMSHIWKYTNVNEIAVVEKVFSE